MKNEPTPALTPKLRFPEFRDAAGWEKEQLGNLCKIRTGKKDANEGAADGEYPFFTCAADHIYSRTYSFDAEAILVAGNANVGQTKYYNGKFEAYQRTYVLTDFSGVSVPYLYAILNANLRESLLGQVQVSAMSYIKLPMLQEYGLPVPPSTAEQRKIADCLSSVDELIAAQARNVDALKTHKKGLMQQLFPREGETQPRLRFPEFEDAGEWETRQLRQLTSKISDGIHATPIYDATGEYAFINGNNLADGRILINEKTKRINVAEFIKYKSPLDDRSILLSINGTIGNLAIFRNEKVILGKSACFININSGLVDKLFIYYSLQSDRIINFFNIELTGSTIKNLSLGTIKSVQLLVPPLPEQQRIADCLTSLDDLIAAQTQKLALLKTHKQGLMQQLFPASEAPTS